VAAATGVQVAPENPRVTCANIYSNIPGIVLKIAMKNPGRIMKTTVKYPKHNYENCNEISKYPRDNYENHNEISQALLYKIAMKYCMHYYEITMKYPKHNYEITMKYPKHNYEITMKYPGIIMKTTMKYPRDNYENPKEISQALL
jgi:hypothetical protein